MPHHHKKKKFRITLAFKKKHHSSEWGGRGWGGLTLAVGNPHTQAGARHAPEHHGGRRQDAHAHKAGLEPGRPVVSQRHVRLCGQDSKGGCQCFQNHVGPPGRESPEAKSLYRVRLRRE